MQQPYPACLSKVIPQRLTRHTSRLQLYMLQAWYAALACPECHGMVHTCKPCVPDCWHRCSHTRLLSVANPSH
jgi:hypothetical protein